MSLKDKIALCSGANFWQTKAFQQYNIPAIFMCDGPHGLRKQEHKDRVDMLGINASLPATCFPTSVTTAGSWDPELLEQIGRAIGTEAAAYDVRLVLGPGANIKRSPLCGRNFEYYSEDPYVTGKLAAGFIRGLQANGTAASLKHFAFNNQEYQRFNSDSVMDERTMREIYLTGFEIAVKESHPAAMMCAYNKLNGVHCSDSQFLLTDILRREWGFEGMVVTDWGGMNDRILGFAAGCDLNMPGGSAYMEKDVLDAVKDGSLAEQSVDDSVARILRLVFSKPPQKVETFDRAEHHALAREAAEQGAVLLKNEAAILPLKESAKIAWIGHMVRHPRYQGSGSSHINPTYLHSVIDLLKKPLYAPGCDELGNTNTELLNEAVKLAESAEVAVVFAGLPEHYESEGFDRAHMQMPAGHIQMIEAVAAANPQTVVVLYAGSVVECPWVDQVRAVLYMGLAGQAASEATLNLLFGKENPSGKLTESWPNTYSDCPISQFYGNHKNAQYREGIYVGYRYFDKAHVPVRFPFGFGLSYTQFSYENLSLKDNEIRVTVTNTGKMAGAEVVQLYVLPPAGGLHRPVKELKGFTKIYLHPGEQKTVKLMINERSFAVWSNGWRVPAGTYTLAVGASSADLRLRIKVKIEGVQVPVPDWQRGSWYETLVGEPPKEKWEQLLGYKYNETKPVKGQFNMDHTIEEMRDQSWIMRVLYRLIEKYVARNNGGKDYHENPEFRMIMASSLCSPLRSIQINSGIKGGVFSGLLDMTNGHFFRGLIKMIRGRVRDH
ncbi:MAG TPA: glycosyl hydrolase [Clostridiaceae bacterium]|nr:glycosyl hydrolase [Clostridiaceae bacterium]